MRVVSLCPSLTELVFALGRGRDLVGRTKFCVHPVGEVDAIETVGGTKNPKLERIFELAPDLVLLNEEENRREDALALDAAGVPCHVSFPRDVAATAEMVRSIGEALDRAEAARAIARSIDERAARVTAAARGLPEVRFGYLIWHEPWKGVGGDTFISAMLSLPGGNNVLSHRAERYPTIIPAELAAADPDVVFLSSEPFPFGPRHVDELAAVTGLQRDRLRLVDGEMLSWHGSRTPHGIDYAESLIATARPDRR